MTSATHPPPLSEGDAGVAVTANALTESAFVDLRVMSSIVDMVTMSTCTDIMIARTARDLGAAVRDARLRRGWTQAELADRIDVSRQWVIAFERGKATAELGTALRAIAALGWVADLVDAPSTKGGVDLDRLLDRLDVAALLVTPTRLRGHRPPTEAV